MLAEDLIVVVKGRINRRDDVPTLYAQELTIPDLTEGPRGPVVVSMPLARCTPPVVERLKDVLATHPGVTEVQLRLTQSGTADGDAARRRAAGHRRPGAVGRPQGAARPVLPGRLTPPGPNRAPPGYLSGCATLVVGTA